MNDVVESINSATSSLGRLSNKLHELEGQMMRVNSTTGNSQSTPIIRKEVISATDKRALEASCLCIIIILIIRLKLSLGDRFTFKTMPGFSCVVKIAKIPSKKSLSRQDMRFPHSIRGKENVAQL